MKKVAKSKTGISLPKEIMDDLDFLASVTHSSRSAVLAAVVGDVVHEAVLSLKESQRLSLNAPDGKAPIGEIAQHVLKAIFAYKSAAVGGLALDFSALDDSRAQ